MMYIDPDDALFQAVHSGHLDFFQQAQRDGRQLIGHLHQTRDSSLLFYAAFYNHPSLVQWFIRQGHPLNDLNHSKQTPLMAAAWMGHLECARLLLEAGADVHLRDDLGQTAFFLATYHHHLPLMRLLLSFQADPYTPDYQLWTPFLLSSFFHHTPSMSFFLDEFPLLTDTVHHENALILLCRQPMPLQSDILPLFQRILSLTSDLDQVDTSGFTALMHAAQHGHFSFCRLLLEAGADLGAQNLLGQTVLDLARLNARLELCSYFESFFLHRQLSAAASSSPDEASDSSSRL